MAYYEEFQGIVLSNRSHREKDGLVKIFSLQHGKTMFFIKNSKQANHPLAQALIPFTKGIFLGHINEKGLSFLKDARELGHLSIVLDDIDANAYTTYMTHLVDAVIDDRVPVPSLFELYSACLTAIQEGKNPQLITHLFELQLLPLFGTYLQLQECVLCQSEQEPFDFSMVKHGVLCQRHWQDDPHRLHIAPKALHIAKLLVRIKPNQIGELRISPETMSELKRLVDAIYEEFVGIHLKSKQFIDQMSNWSQELVKRRQEPN